jgi:hypothetical protein
MMDQDTLREELVRTLPQLSARGLNRGGDLRLLSSLQMDEVLQRFRDYGQRGD